MSLPPEVREAATAHVAVFCRERCPEELRDEVTLEYDVRANAITIIERRAPWRPESGPEWTSSTIAQLRYDPATATWSLHWPDSRGRWLPYEGVNTARDVGPLLAEVGADPHGSFWG